MVYVVYRDRAGQWRWNLTSTNGRKLADSGEGYFNKQDCLSAVNLVKGSSLAPVRVV
jgi:uncharacterized protein YegP (UPF0339 family)